MQDPKDPGTLDLVEACARPLTPAERQKRLRDKRRREREEGKRATLDFGAAELVVLAAFDPSTRRCTMNCGPSGLDPRSRAERLLLCDDCEVVPPAGNGNTPCKHCGSQDQSWQTHNVARGGVQNGRLRLSEVECQFVLGCNHCSETLAVLSADRVAGMMNAALD